MLRLMLHAAYSHEQFVHGETTPQHCPTSLQPADVNTKNLARPARTMHYKLLSGHKYFPTPGTKHYELLQLELFDKPFRHDLNDGD